MRILAFSDVHGHTEAVKRMVSEVSDEEFDAVVFAGDFTNAWFDGIERGEKQMDELVPLIESLDRPFYYIYGNRDSKHGGMRRVECPVGQNVEEEDRDIGGYTLTSDTERLDESKILVTHSRSGEFEDRKPGCFLYLYGHDHIGRIRKNEVDLGFLHRGSEAHGAHRSLYGCYWFIELDDDKFSVENHSWDLRKSVCSTHRDQGTLFVPSYWRKDCPRCYDEEEDGREDSKGTTRLSDF